MLEVIWSLLVVAVTRRSPDLHCWADGPREVLYDGGGYPVDEVGSTCLLGAGHAGPHEWTPDDFVGVTFTGDRSPLGV